MIPLSTRMRPISLDDFFGQSHFMYRGSLFYNSIKRKNFDSAIFFGPSGTGKTTLARIIAREMEAEFVELNATTSGTKELKEIIELAKLRFYGLEKQTTYLYIDEIHRWNKLQQDALLQYLEEGIIKFIGSTTENPYFSINGAILSRTGNIYEFKRHTKEDLRRIIDRAISDKVNGLGSLDITFEEDAISILIDLSNGDSRIALDTLGFVCDNMEGGRVTQALVMEALQRRVTAFNPGDDRYDLLSALQKSVRGSDPDAALHYLARLIDGGADLMMISRRLLVMASEDVGMAYPQAISIVTSCVQAAQMVGFPEATINLSHAVVLMASSPKSNASNQGYIKALSDIKSRKIEEVPNHLRDTHYNGAKDRGFGGYKYPHNYGGFVVQQYLPDDLYKEGTIYYEPTENGSEKAFGDYIKKLRELSKKKRREE